MLAYLLAYASKILSLGWDSNPHAFRPRLLRPLRIPIPPPKVIVRAGLEPARPEDTGLSCQRVYHFRHLTLVYRYGETRTPNPFRARTSQARMYTFHHIPLYYRSEGTRTPNPCLSRPPGLSRCCIPIPITDRFSRSTRIRTQTSGLGNHYASHYKHTPK